MNHKGKSEHDPNVWQIKDRSKAMKNAYIDDILMYSDKRHTREELQKKNLNRIKEIYEKEVG